MTDRAARKRATKRELRAWAWIAGGLAFLAPWAALGASPRPAVVAAQGSGGRSVILIRELTRRVVIQHPATQAPVQVVYAGSGSSASSSASSGSSGGGSVQAAPPAPTTSTGGS